MGSYSASVTRLLGVGIAALAATLLMSGCGKEQGGSATEKAASAASSSDPYQPGAPLPPNHPPLDGPADNGLPPGHMPVGGEGEMTGHPAEVTAARIKDVEIVVPENVKGKWSAVQLAVSGGEIKEKYEVALGGKTEIPQGMELTVDAFLPDYTSDFEKATSASEKMNNPAALVHVMKGEKLVAKGWIFKNYPEFNTFRSDAVQIELLDAKPADKKANKEG